MDRHRPGSAPRRLLGVLFAVAVLVATAGHHPALGSAACSSPAQPDAAQAQPDAAQAQPDAALSRVATNSPWGVAASAALSYDPTSGPVRWPGPGSPPCGASTPRTASTGWDR
jgi:hypothetical protein